MAIKKILGNVDVLTAAKARIVNVFKSSPKLYLSFSSGKDSLCVSSIIYDLAVQGEIDPTKLTVNFIDEEALYPSMVEASERWRRNFLGIGAKFHWYCLPFKQVCTLNTLTNCKSWITWEPGKEDVWMRVPPKYAITKSSILHYAGEMNYQKYMDIATRDGISIIGLRGPESLTRVQTISKLNLHKSNGRFYPIYDWQDSDVWRYIKERNLEFPEIYIRLYEAGVRKHQLRLSAFFGDKTTQGLRWISETDPELWGKIERRIPNAYLVMLYWDSEFFARNTEKRKKLEEEKECSDYCSLCIDLLFKNTDRYRINKDTRRYLRQWQKFFIEIQGKVEEKWYREIYEAVLAGDPKRRAFRELQMRINGGTLDKIKEKKL